MKKNILLPFILLHLFFCCGCSPVELNTTFPTKEHFVQETQEVMITYSGECEEMNDCCLVVNGTVAHTEHRVIINSIERYAELPLITIMEYLGGTIEWIDSTNAQIIYDDTIFYLNVTENSLSEKGRNINYIELPPGTTHGGRYRFVDGEFYIDNDCLQYYMMNIGYTISISYNQLTVYIEKAS